MESPLLRTIRPLLLASQPFCATPYLQWSAPANPKRTRFLRYLNRLYACAYLAIVIYAFYLQTFDLSRHTELLEWLVLSVRILCYFINVFIIVIGAQRQHQLYGQFIQDLAAIDAQLQWISTKSASNLRGLRRFILVSTTALFSVMFTSAIVDYFVYDRRSIRSWLRSVVVFLASNCTISLAIVQLSSGLWCIADRFANVATLMRTTLSRTADHNGRKLAQLTALRSLHMDVAQLHDKLLAAFGLFMVCLVTSSVVDLTVQLYMLYIYAVSVEQDTDGYLTIYTVLWFTMHASKMAVVLWFGDRVQTEKMSLPLVAAEAYVGNSGWGREDKELNDQLLKLQIQAMHDRRPCVVNGIVQMDLTLVASMIGSITGLLVILIQYAST